MQLVHSVVLHRVDRCSQTQRELFCLENIPLDFFPRFFFQICVICVSLYIVFTITLHEKYHSPMFMKTRKGDLFPICLVARIGWRPGVNREAARLHLAVHKGERAVLVSVLHERRRHKEKSWVHIAQSHMLGFDELMEESGCLPGPQPEKSN